MKLIPTRSLLLAVALLGAVPACADAPLARTAAAEAAPFQRDRADILNMAGNYDVTFDMTETTAWRKDYQPIPTKVSGGHEAVRVVEDSGRRIVLQHLLVVKDQGGKAMVIKHWRQDWTYEPETVLVYAGKGRWNLEAVPAAMRGGRWSQTVWQTDDSPRYGGWGQWTQEGGVRRWQSNATWRPLARRDAVRRPPYDRYLAINRHSPSPSGWIHWQDNIKMGPEPGNAAGPNARIVPFVQETVLNTYERDPGFDSAAADVYWAATKDYWSAIRRAWDETILRGNGVTVAEVAETGSAGAERLMTLADEIEARKLTTAQAIEQARAVIVQVSGAGR